MPLHLGATSASKVYLGATPATKVYLGATQVWPAGAPAAASYSDIVAADSPIAWYRGNGTLVDAIPGGSPATAMNGATFGPALTSVGGQSFSLDGVDDYFSAPDQAKLDLTGQITIECWAWLDTLKAPGQFGTLFWKGATSATNRFGFQLVQNRVETQIGSNHYIRSSALATNTLYHFVGVRTTTALNLYVNGQLDNAITSGTFSTATTANTEPLRIGSWDGAIEFLDGRIGEIAIYNRALTTAEINEHYTAGTP